MQRNYGMCSIATDLMNIRWFNGPPLEIFKLESKGQHYLAMGHFFKSCYIICYLRPPSNHGRFIDEIGMRRHNSPLFPSSFRRPSPTVFWHKLNPMHIQHCTADFALVKTSIQCVLADQCLAGSIHQQGRRLHKI